MSDGLTADELRARIRTLEEALLNGRLSVSFGGDGASHAATYRSAADIERALGYARARLAEISGGAGGMTTIANFTRCGDDRI